MTEIAEQVFDLPVRRGSPAGATVSSIPIGHNTPFAMGLALYGAATPPPRKISLRVPTGAFTKQLRSWFSEMF